MSGLITRRRGRWVLLVAILGVSAAAAWFGGRQAWAGFQLRSARQDLARGRCAQARPKLDLCRTVWPENAEILLLSAQAARRCGDFDAAEGFLLACQRREGTPSEASVLEYSLLRAEAGDPETVEDFLRGLIARGHPQSQLILEAMVKGYLSVYRFPDAMNCLDVWMKLDPDSAQAHFLRGRAWQQVSSFGRAGDEYRKAVENDAEHDEARLLLANALIETGKTAEAIPHLEHLRQRQPENPEVLVRLAFAWNDQGQTDMSREVLDALLAKHPRFPAALHSRGQIELQAHRPAAAERWFRQAVAESPYLHQAQYGLYLALQQQDKVLESKEQLARLKKLEETIDRIAEVSNHLMPQSPHDPKVHHELGTLLAQIGQEDMAVHWYYSALRQQPDFRPAHDALVEHYTKIGDAEKAQRHRQRQK